MPLTDTAIRTAKPSEKPFKLYDQKGLYLLVTAAGGKWWRIDYRFVGKRQTLSLGVYPDVTLKEARDKCAEVRRQIAAGIDPSVHRKAQKSARAERAANSFELVAREWFTKHAPNWAENHANRIIRRLEKDIFPWLG
ncbi:MAG: Arm DNA-binding domain-containing protein, partial [Candidatus Competibacteraceae bacterium]|nr:Arm DNA-binding domain-containing protein [Candidatus Competibacteraceae bacterium]